MHIGMCEIGAYPYSFPRIDAVDPEHRLIPEITPPDRIFSNVTYVIAEAPRMVVVVARGL
jgi:hypothetical protein